MNVYFKWNFRVKDRKFKWNSGPTLFGLMSSEASICNAEEESEWNEWQEIEIFSIGFLICQIDLVW